MRHPIDPYTFVPGNRHSDHLLKLRVEQERKQFGLLLESMTKSECVSMARDSNHESIKAKRRRDLDAVLKHVLVRYACMDAAREKREGT